MSTILDTVSSASGAYTPRWGSLTPISWRIFEGIVFLTSDEAGTLDEWRSAVTSALYGRPSWRLLHDAREMTRVPDAAETHARVRFLVTQARTHNVSRWALVVAGRAGQMGEALTMAESLTDADRRSVAFRVFTDMTEAEIWLREGPQPP